jgi:hypothetical protein
MERRQMLELRPNCECCDRQINDELRKVVKRGLTTRRAGGDWHKAPSQLTVHSAVFCRAAQPFR